MANSSNSVVSAPPDRWGAFRVLVAPLPGLTPGEKLILVQLVFVYGLHGELVGGVRQVAKQMGLAHQTLVSALQKFERQEYLEVVDWGPTPATRRRGRPIKVYRISLPWKNTPEPLMAVSESWDRHEGTLMRCLKLGGLELSMDGSISNPFLRASTRLTFALLMVHASPIGVVTDIGMGLLGQLAGLGHGGMKEVIKSLQKSGVLLGYAPGIPRNKLFKCCKSVFIVNLSHLVFGDGRQKWKYGIFRLNSDTSLVQRFADRLRQGALVTSDHLDSGHRERHMLRDKPWQLTLDGMIGYFGPIGGQGEVLREGHTSGYEGAEFTHVKSKYIGPLGRSIYTVQDILSRCLGKDQALYLEMVLLVCIGMAMSGCVGKDIDHRSRYTVYCYDDAILAWLKSLFQVSPGFSFQIDKERSSSNPCDDVVLLLYDLIMVAATHQLGFIRKKIMEGVSDAANWACLLVEDPNDISHGRRRTLLTFTLTV